MDEFLKGLRAKRAEVELERVTALKDAETSAFQVEHLQREVRAAQASQAAAEERALKAMKAESDAKTARGERFDVGFGSFKVRAAK